MKRFLQRSVPKMIYLFLREVRQATRKKVENVDAYRKSTLNRSGVEIGGPSTIFKYQIPVYAGASNLEFVNFASETIWEGVLSDDVVYYRGRIGKQHVAEAVDLQIFSDQKFSFLLSSNCLEHVANPIKALFEWKRVTSGVIILVLPRNEFNFDRKRPITSFEHLLEDFKNDVDESDMTHFLEIMSLHDLDLDPPAGSPDHFKKRSLENYKNRCLHHHVFDDKLVSRICEYLGMSVVESSRTKKDWIFLIDTNN
jgi:hypothetical protein